MARIATYVFLDLETTGLPSEEINKTKITELSMVAVKRQHVLETRPGATPRVQHKLTLCFNPGRLVQPDGTKVTGLCNDLLENETYFNDKVFIMIDMFLKVLTPPVCLIGQNGLNFDFPILKAHLDKLKSSFSGDLMCADCYHAFYDIMEAMKKDIPNDQTPIKSELGFVKEKEKSEEFTSCDETDLISITNTISMQAINERTPTKPPAQNFKKPDVVNEKEKRRTMKSKARRRFPWSEGEKPKDSYKLANIYERLLNRPAINAHRAENDCIMALECSVVLCKQFVEWVDNNSVAFSIIKPMTVGVKIGD